MAYKYDQNKVYHLLNSYVELIKDDIDGEMCVAGGGDCPYVWIEVAYGKKLEEVEDENDVICFFIDEDTGKLFYQENAEFQIEPETIFLEKNKTKKNVKEFLIDIINQKGKQNV